LQTNLATLRNNIPFPRISMERPYINTTACK
jgi:hypothetical protein